ncbi:MAG TPA: 50S ribosomal protein L25 [Isosphaeraceae bacterium]
MAGAVKIQAELRDAAKNKGTGTRVARRIRKAGRIPAIVYGHKLDTQPISIGRDAIWSMLKTSTHLAELQWAGGGETVLVKDIQWDHLGKEILHVDFARVSADETVDAVVRLDLKGEAPGVVEGGVLEHLVHSIHVVCRAIAIPDSIKVDISGLHLNQGIHLRDLVLPEGVVAKGDPDLLIVHVTSRVTVAEPAPGTEPAEGATSVQPEVIKAERKEKEA